MKYTLPAAVLLGLLLAACNGQEQGQTEQSGNSSAASAPLQASAERPSENHANVPASDTKAAAPEVPEHLKAGKAIYDKRCKACHGEDGNGSNAALPPLGKSDYFAQDKMQLVASIAKGIRGKITVNGKEYDGIMPSFPLKDEEIAAVSTYVLNSFGNAGGEVTAQEVADYRAGKQ
ncbi:Cytochrome c552 [Kingella potus]|uniref:Cytochrome c552 n=1 Tax=Kingella potus TaxID=265175 RepID=A0A377QZD8_9NEIS|nr:cytochrome c [Kingella potus]STR00352.1 Cytochrome c552 [Kingella potus]